MSAPALTALPKAHPPDLAPAGIYLQPGHIVVSARPSTVSAILGSCLAVGLWDFSAGVGGLCHFLLPQWMGAGSASSPRFGNFAVGELLRQVCEAGAARQRLFAKIFGGASVLERGPEFEPARIGRRNVELARSLLADAGIPILAEDVGGNRGRKLMFQTHDGNAWVKLLESEGKEPKGSLG